jgi:ubiquinone/menaquinone biosynthesis C-methylase UbiE
MKKQTSATGWGKVSGWYEKTIENEKSTQQEVILPSLLPILKNMVKDKVVLDLGCGTGFFIHTLLISGAKKVMAVDVDEELLRVVKEKYANTDKVEVIQADAEKLGGIDAGSVDVILSVESLVNMRRLDKVITEMRRVLSKDGKALAVVNHPCFRVPQSSDWYYDMQAKRQGRVVYTYSTSHEIKIDMNPGSKINKKFTYTFHRSLTEYMKFFNKNRLAVTNMTEVYSNKTSQAGALRKREEDMARKEIPLFLIFELQKMS